MSGATCATQNFSVFAPFPAYIYGFGMKRLSIVLTAFGGSPIVVWAPKFC